MCPDVFCDFYVGKCRLCVLLVTGSSFRQGWVLVPSLKHGRYQQIRPFLRVLSLYLGRYLHLLGGAIISITFPVYDRFAAPPYSTLLADIPKAKMKKEEATFVVTSSLLIVGAMIS